MKAHAGMAVCSFSTPRNFGSRNCAATRIAFHPSGLGPPASVESDAQPCVAFQNHHGREPSANAARPDKPERSRSDERMKSGARQSAQATMNGAAIQLFQNARPHTSPKAANVRGELGRLEQVIAMAATSRSAAMA